MNVQEALLAERIDPCLDDARLTRLATDALGTKAPVHGYRVLTGGCWNRVIAVEAGDCSLVIKISPHPADAGIIREFTVLQRFREETALPVPEPLMLDSESRFTPGTTMVMRRITGVVMHECLGMLGGHDRRRITREIAEHIAALHTIRSRGFGGVELNPDDRHRTWPEFWLPRYDRALEEVAASGAAPDRLMDAAREIRPELATHLEVGEESTLTHYDVWSGNVMINVAADPPRVSGYIDIPGFFADYARELSFAMLFGVANRSFFESYSRHHQIDDGFELRTSIYNLKMNLRHIQMYPSERFYQEGAAACLATIERLLS